MASAARHPAEAPEPIASTGALVAICGPPNVGKSTFFNRLTGLRQKVANYPGITVEKRIGSLDLPNGGRVDLIDLPGIVGLHPRSEDERISLDVLRGASPAHTETDRRDLGAGLDEPAVAVAPRTGDPGIRHSYSRRPQYVGRSLGARRQR